MQDVSVDAANVGIFTRRRLVLVDADPTREFRGRA